MLLAGRMFPFDKQVFRAKKTHSFSAIGLYSISVRGVLNVSLKAHATASERYRRLQQQFAQLFLERQMFADQLPVFVERLVSWTDNDYPIESVQQRILTAL